MIDGKRRKFLRRVPAYVGDVLHVLRGAVELKRVKVVVAADKNFVGIAALLNDGIFRAVTCRIQPVDGGCEVKLFARPRSTERGPAVGTGFAFFLIGTDGGFKGILRVQLEAVPRRGDVVHHVVMAGRGQGTYEFPTARHVAPACAEGIRLAVEDAGGAGAGGECGHTAELQLAPSLRFNPQGRLTFENLVLAAINGTVVREEPGFQVEDHLGVRRQLFASLDTPGADVARALSEIGTRDAVSDLAVGTNRIGSFIALALRRSHSGIQFFMNISKALIKEPEHFNIGSLSGESG